MQKNVLGIVMRPLREEHEVCASMHASTFLQVCDKICIIIQTLPYCQKLSLEEKFTKSQIFFAEKWNLK